MATETLRIAGIVRGNSAETVRKATEVARHVTRPDEEITRTFRTLPGGMERLEVKVFRLGDYFDKVELVTSESDEPATFTIVFHVKQGVDSSWKPLLLAVLRTISEGVPGISASILPPGEKP